MGNAYRSVLDLKPTGDAVPANVLAGKTFSNADGTGKIGTMVNNGAVSITLTDQDPTYTIPEGYHNGLGVVGFSSSGGDGADLVVTCSGNFAGTTITCTDGTTTFEEICPITSPYQVVFQSIPTGTWTISGTYSGHTFSTIFTVLNFETELNYIPEGSTVTPTDDIQTWLNCANIRDKTYTSLSEVLADPSTLQAVIASNNAADYMVRSTTWANGVVADSSAMTYIGLNDYCANKLLADSTWLNAICNSTYFESVLNVKVPTMTSDSTPSGVASASSVLSGRPAYYAFDGNDSSSWACSTQTYANEYIQYKFSNALKIYYALYDAGSHNGSRVVSTVDLLGSNNGTDWDTLISDWGNDIPSTQQVLTHIFNSPQKYAYYKIACKTGVAGSRASAITIQFYGRS